MDQHILPQAKNRSFARFLASLLGFDGYKSVISRGVRVADFERQTLLVSVDALLLLVGLVIAWRFGQPYLTVFADTGVRELDVELLSWYWPGTLLTTWFLFGWLNDLYDVRSAHVNWLSTARIIVVISLSVLVAVLIAYLFSIAYPPGKFLLFYFGIGFLLVAVWRYAYAGLSRTPIFFRRVMVLGTGKSARMAANLLDQAQGLDYELLGHVGEAPGTETRTCGNLPIWYITTSLLDLARGQHADEIVVAVDSEPNATLYKELIACQAHGISVSTVPTIYNRLCQKVPVEHINSSWLLEAVQHSSSKMRHLCKRIMDLTVSILALPWFLLVFPLIAVAIKLDSRGPIFYRQVRSGMGGKPFEILKFRTMFTDAEQDGRPQWATKDDQRITRVGRLLRKSRLDELPQFINILRGDMSLIGPRPERPEFIEQLERELPYYYTRMLVPPGLTGWAQIKYTYSNSVEGALIKLQYDVYYVRHWSMWMDIYILFQTVNVVLRAKGT